MRKDGKFIGVDGSIPEGQGIVMAHLNECHELLEMVCHLPNVDILIATDGGLLAQGTHGRRS